MEEYQGIKFQYSQNKTSFSYDDRLGSLNHWAFLFSQLGLAPVHSQGAYGNHSYRTGKTSFVITKSAMIPSEKLQPNDYCHVVAFDSFENSFVTEGIAPPSSESYLHYAIYQSHPHIHAILHGHCSLLNIHAADLGIPVTKKFCDYGTRELADSALSIISPSSSFIILKDHGFIAIGDNINDAGRVTLNHHAELINLLIKQGSLITYK